MLSPKCLIQSSLILALAFGATLEAARAQQRELGELSMDEMEALWQEAKRIR